VPAFTEDMPLRDGPVIGGAADDDLDDAGPVAPRPAPRPEATGSGRTVPEAKAPIEQSGSAHRPQPTRQPRSKRGK